MKLSFQNDKGVSGKSPVFVKNQFCTSTIFVLLQFFNKVVFFGNVAFFKKRFSFPENFKVKVNERFKTSTGYRIKCADLSNGGQFQKSRVPF